MMRVITLRRVALFLSSSFCFDPRLRDFLCFLCVNFAAGNKIKTTIFEFYEFYNLKTEDEFDLRFLTLYENATK